MLRCNIYVLSEELFSPILLGCLAPSPTRYSIIRVLVCIFAGAHVPAVNLVACEGYLLRSLEGQEPVDVSPDSVSKLLSVIRAAEEGPVVQKARHRRLVQAHSKDVLQSLVHDRRSNQLVELGLEPQGYLHDHGAVGPLQDERPHQDVPDVGLGASRVIPALG